MTEARQHECLEYLRHLGVEVVEMAELDSLFRKYGCMDVLEMVVRGGSSNGLIVRDEFEEWGFTMPFDTDQQFVLVIPGRKGKRMASIYLFDAEEIVREMHRLDEFEEWNANRLWAELEDVPFREEDGDMDDVRQSYNSCDIVLGWEDFIGVDFEVQES